MSKDVIQKCFTEVLIEEELGQNPESGEGWTEYNFQAARLPKETYALGIVELVPRPMRS